MIKKNFVIKLYNPVTGSDKVLKVYAVNLKQAKLQAENFLKLCTTSKNQILFLYRIDSSAYYCKVGSKWHLLFE